MAGYDYTLNGHCVAVLLESLADAGRLEQVFSQLAAAPFSAGDYREEDARGRKVEVILKDEWLVTFWPDHAEKRVHIVDLERLG